MKTASCFGPPAGGAKVLLAVLGRGELDILQQHMVKAHALHLADEVADEPDGLVGIGVEPGVAAGGRAQPTPSSP